MLTEKTSPAIAESSKAAAVPTVRLCLGALILLGFGVRVWNLGAQSLWLDEALSVIFSRPSLDDVLTILATQDLHPPLYYVALHFWLRLAGSTEFAVRFLSLIFGLPAIPATYLLGVSLFRGGAPPYEESGRGRQVGLIAAALVTISPFLVYYSQEARMYSALATFGVLSSLALWNLLLDRRWPWWLGYVGFTTATIYSQYLGGLIVAFQAIFLLGYLVRHRRPALVAASGLAATAVAYVPWVPGATQQVDRLVTIPDFWKGDFQLSYLIGHVFAAFALGQFAALRGNVAVAAIVAGIVGIGLALLAWRALRRGGGEAYVLTYLIVPTLLLYAIVARDPKFAERYLIMVAPPFYLVVALSLTSAVSWLRQIGDRRLRCAGYAAVGAMGLAIAMVSFAQIDQIYYGATYRKDDNRGAINYIEQHAQPGDVVALMMNTYQVYVYYARGDVPYEALQPGGDIEGAAARLNQIVAGHKRLWLLSWNPEWADPSRFVRDSLEHAYPQVPVPEQFAGLGLNLYVIDPSYHFSAKTVPSIAHPVNFSNQLGLLGYDLPRTKIEAGQSATITLYWQALAAINADYIISLRLKDDQFYWWRHDDRPAAYNFPTMYWRPGQVVTGDVPIQIPPGTPPGTYALELGVYGQGEGSDLNVLQNGNVATGTAATIATITVTRPSTPPAVNGLGIPKRIDAKFGANLKLLGASLSTTRASRGDPVDVTLWWQDTLAPTPDYRIRLTMVNGNLTRLVEEQPPVSGRYGTNRWSAGEIVADRHRLTIPVDLPAGTFDIEVGVWDSRQASDVGTAHGESVSIGTLTVLDRQRLMTAPSGIETPTNLEVGSFAELIGSTLSATRAKPGEQVALTLYWRSKGNSGETPYTVFTHLLDSKQIVKAQQDHQPGDGNDPTTGWTSGEYIVDHYDLTVSADAKPGTYVVEIGMYNPATGQRLPVADAAGAVTGDRAVIAKVEIE